MSSCLPLVSIEHWRLSELGGLPLVVRPLQRNKEAGIGQEPARGAKFWAGPAKFGSAFYWEIFQGGDSCPPTTFEMNRSHLFQQPDPGHFLKRKKEDVSTLLEFPDLNVFWVWTIGL